ncbi:undecaprenyl-phosphate glucose phosphotransferase [Ramlibacter sp. MAHUQ-53]|uniref:undecaprenyl-phosphate glucose phosphotransferase n=1 Tax=unclassified Ramlibacter TaxID=2617605 RepID=UPI0036455885
MPDAASPRQPAALLPAPPGSDSGLVRLLEAWLEPLAAVLSLWALAAWREGALTLPWAFTGVLAFALAYPAPPRLRQPWRQALGGLLGGWLLASGLLLFAAAATGEIHRLAPGVLLPWLALAPVLQVAAHLALRRAAPRLARLEGPPLRAVVVGLNPQGRALAERLARTRDAGVTLVGWFDDRAGERVPTRPGYLGRLDDVAAVVTARRVHLIYLSLPMASQPRVRALLEALEDTTASVYFVPDLFVTDLIQGRADTICGLPVISVCETPFRGAAGALKRASDLVLASLILLLLAPLMLAVAAAIRCTSRGPVIFRQRRYGLGGEEIVVWKFRSMTVAEDGPQIAQARRGDARITPLGAFLRRTSLDELPQFFNVLQGRMSIVGPRPHAVAHNELYRARIRAYMVRHKVRPGITGWAQVNGFRGETDSLDKMEGRIRLDLEYLRRWSLGLDLLIILRTIRLVFFDRAAY